MTAPSAYRLEQAVAALQKMRERILAEDGDVASDWAEVGGSDWRAGDAETEVRNLLARVLRAAGEAADFAAAAAKRIDEIQARRDRYKRREEMLRGTAYAVLDVLGEKRVELPDLTATIGTGPAAVVVTDEKAVMAAGYVRTTREVNKAELGRDLKAGVVVDGAELGNGVPTLTIRRG